LCGSVKLSFSAVLVGHALELFIDFIKIFVRLLIILSKDKKEKKNSR